MSISEIYPKFLGCILFKDGAPVHISSHTRKINIYWDTRQQVSNFLPKILLASKGLWIHNGFKKVSSWPGTRQCQ